MKSLKFRKAGIFKGRAMADAGFFEKYGKRFWI